MNPITRIVALIGNLAIVIVATMLIFYGVSLVIDIEFQFLPAAIIGIGLYNIKNFSIVFDKDK